MIIGLNFISCREDINQTNSDNPNIGGDYTEIKGDISGIFSLSNSPFLIVDNINVSSSDTLIIEPGVTLFFNKNTSLIVQGNIIAEGTKDLQILFSPYSYEDAWSGIRIENRTAKAKFKFCIVEGVYLPNDGQNSYGALAVINSLAEIRNCVFRYNSTPYGGGLCLITSSAIILNNIIRNNEADFFGAAMYIESSAASIINNTIFNNLSYYTGGALVFSNPAATELQNNIFYHNYSFDKNNDRRIAVIEGDSLKIDQQFNFLDSDSLTPGFISATDLHLTSVSVCKDSGNPAIDYNDFDGTRNDQGAYGGPGGNW